MGEGRRRETLVRLGHQTDKLVSEDVKPSQKGREVHAGDETKLAWSVRFSIHTFK